MTCSRFRNIRKITLDFNEYRNKVSPRVSAIAQTMPITRRGNRRRRNYLSVHLKLTGTPAGLPLQNFHPRRVARCVSLSLSFFRYGRRRRRRQPTDGEEQQFPEEYPDLRGSSRISNKFSAKHVTNEFRGTGLEGRRNESTVRIYTYIYGSRKL